MILVDATTLLSLGKVGEIELLLHFDEKPAVIPSVDDEVTTEPARTNLNRFYEHEDVRSPSSGFISSDMPIEHAIHETERILDQSEMDGDFGIIFVVLIRTNAEHPVGVVSDDRRVRTIADGLGATVTGTIGVVVRAVEEELSEREGKELIREIDRHGLHMTGELREKADKLVEEAAE